MGVPREDLLLMTRALKRGLADVKAIRKALDRQVSKPISFLQALHLGEGEVQALKADATLPDPIQDRGSLEALHAMLLDGEHLTPSEWEKFLASLTRPVHRHEYAALSMPQEFDGYALQWELARRERGVVFRARDKEGREVAIKVFRKEVPLTGDLPRVDGLAYSVMPFVDGESLESKRPGTPRRAAQVIETAAHLLRTCAHGALAPARILVRKNDSVVVIGFEHAGAVAPSARTRAYGEKNDVHALGAILYDLLTGAPPASETSPAARSRDVDADLDRIVSCALSGGYGTMSEFADDLGRYLRGEPVTARRVSAAASGQRRFRGWIAAVAAIVLAAAAVAAVLFSKKEPPDQVKAPPPSEAPKPAVPPPAPPPEPSKPPPKRETARPPEPPKPLTSDDDQRLYDASFQASGAGDWDRVIAVGNEAISRGSKKDWAPYHLATAYAERDELDKALEYVTRALQIKPDARESLELRAQILVFRGEGSKAFAALEDLHGKKVSEYTRQVFRLTKLIDADAKDWRSRQLRGVYYLLKKHKDYSQSAQKDFTTSLELGRVSGRVWRAIASQSLDDRAGAKADLEAYLAECATGYAAEEAKALLKELGGK
jgi:serine/threonine protein kinase